MQGNDQVAQSSEQPTVTSEVVGSIPTSDSWHLCEELVQRSAGGRQFTPGTPLWECWQGGWDCKISAVNGTYNKLTARRT